MTEFMIFGPMIIGLSFWPAIFFWALLSILFVELIFDHGLVAFSTLCVALFGAYWLGFWSVDFISQYHRAFLWLFAFYIPLGIVWATMKWFLYCHGVADKVRDYLRSEEKNSLTVKAEPRRLGPQTPEAYMTEIKKNITHRFEELPPKVYNHKSDLMRWVGWWPFSIITSMFDDLLRRFFLAIYNGFARIWQRISDHIFRGIDLTIPEEKAKSEVV